MEEFEIILKKMNAPKGTIDIFAEEVYNKLIKTEHPTIVQNLFRFFQKISKLFYEDNKNNTDKRLRDSIILAEKIKDIYLHFI